MPSITNGALRVDFSISSKDSSGNFTISATVYNTSSTVATASRLSCSLDNSSGWKRIEFPALSAGGSASGSTTFSSGNTGAQNVYCYLLVSGQSSGPGGAYSVGAYVPPTPPPPTYYNHTLTYDANGGEGVPSSQTITNTSYSSFIVQLSNVKPTRAGHKFLGWSINSTSPTAEYEPNGTYTFNTLNATIYAIWQEIPTYDLTINKVGQGTITINGTTPTSTYYQGTLTLEIVPTSMNYLKSVEVNGITIYDTHTIKKYSYSFEINRDTEINVELEARSQHTLSVSSQYEVSGQGTYYYLDTAILLASFDNLVIFDGFYEGDTKLSSNNPFQLTMPNRDLILTIRTGGEIFDNFKVRQFAIQNGKGEIYKLTSKNSNIFLNNPNGLGYSKRITTSRLGNAEKLTNETYSMPTISGELVFFENGISGKYKDYYDFVRFISQKPITLWYKIPTDMRENIYHIPVEVMEISKTEIKENNLLSVNISMYGLNFWQLTETVVQTESNNVEVYNDSDYEVGLKVEIMLDQAVSFNNPKIKLIQDNAVYGAIAILKNGITKIELDTRDTKQSLTLYDGNDIIVNPFAYIDFSYADGKKQFPFPKLKQGYTTIEFTYDNEDSTDKLYVVEYDKEFLSV